MTQTEMTQNAPQVAPQDAAIEAPRDWKQAARRGFAMRCPHCGEGEMFHAYLKVSEACPKCGEELHHQRADDAPPYMTIFVVGHVVAAMLMVADGHYPALPMWIHMVLWPLVAILMSLWFLPRIKGALIGYQWALRMHGFHPDSREDDLMPVPAP